MGTSDIRLAFRLRMTGSFLMSQTLLRSRATRFLRLGITLLRTAYDQQRAVFAATDYDPGKVWLSRSGSYKNFTYRSPIQDDDAITFTIAGRQVNRVQHLVEVNQLLILTSGGEWLVLGDGDGAIRPTAINLRQQGYNGSSSLAPIVVANNALYVQARGSVVRDLRYDFGSDGYTGRDLTVFAPHMVDGYQLLAWDYQQIPHSVVWSVRDDGTLLGLTYVKEHEVWGGIGMSQTGFSRMFAAFLKARRMPFT
jgi:hypothetical protein